MVEDSINDVDVSQDFTWNLIQIKDDSISLQLIWEDAKQISKEGEQLEMTLKLNTEILGPDYEYDEPYPVLFEIPPQLTSQEQEQLQVIEQQAETAKNLAQAAVAGF